MASASKTARAKPSRWAPGQGRDRQRAVAPSVEIFERGEVSAARVQIALVGHQQLRRRYAPGGQMRGDELDFIENLDVAGVHHEDAERGRAQHLRKPGFVELFRDRRQIHQLDLDVLVFHHAGQRHARGEGIIGHLGVGVRERGQKLRLAGVGWADQSHLPGAFLVHQVERRRVRGAFLLRILAGLRQPPLDVGLHLLGPLVLGDGGEHALEGGDFFGWGLGGLIVALGAYVIGTEIRRHGLPACKNSKGELGFDNPRHATLHWDSSAGCARAPSPSRTFHSARREMVR